MTWFMVDIESDGPCPSCYNMISFGAVIVEPGLSRTFYGQCRPVHEAFVPEAFAVCGHTREEVMAFPHPKETMAKFKEWVETNAGQTKPTVKRPYSKTQAYFVSDNNGFDWMFICDYFHRFCGDNPFGYSSTNLGSLYKGLVHDVFQNFKFLRKTKHTHHPVMDAKGNAEALLAMKEMGLKIKW